MYAWAAIAGSVLLGTSLVCVACGNDGDGEGDRCDTDDGRILLWWTLQDQVDWQEEAGYVAWNVYRGDFEVLRSLGLYTQIPGSNALAARWCDRTDAWLSSSDVPAPSGLAFFLVSGSAGGVEGDLGEDSSGTTRPNINPCP